MRPCTVPDFDRSRAATAMRAADSGAARLWLQAMPGLFVLLWSTGFVSAKYGLPYAEPLTFLLLRFVLVVSLMLPLALANAVRMG